MRIIRRVWAWDKYTRFSNTQHVIDRNERISRYAAKLNTNFVAAFEVDKGHRDGNEVHLINDEAMIYVVNERSKRLITILAGRPGQIKRYYDAPSWLVSKARENVRGGMHVW